LMASDPSWLLRDGTIGSSIKPGQYSSYEAEQ
jgi:hypothetical protein